MWFFPHISASCCPYPGAFSELCASLFPSHHHVRLWREIAESYLTWDAFWPLEWLICAKFSFASLAMTMRSLSEGKERMFAEAEGYDRSFTKSASKSGIAILGWSNGLFDFLMSECIRLVKLDFDWTWTLTRWRRCIPIRLVLISKLAQNC